VRRETPRETPIELRAYGRRTFLAVTGIGLSSLLWAKPAWQVVSGATQPLQNALPARADPVLGLAHLHGRSDDAPGSTRTRGACASTGSSSSPSH
jgi:hypothetical protein